MSDAADCERAAFVVRLWRRGAAGDAWVGRVTRLSSNTTRSFSGVDELLALVRDEVTSAEVVQRTEP